MHAITTNAAGRPQRLQSSGEERTMLRENVEAPTIDVRADQGKVRIDLGGKDSLCEAIIIMTPDQAKVLAARIVAAVRAAGG